jgi:hypothetical protein
MIVETTDADGTESEIGKQAESSGTSMIYVDYSAPATLHYSGTSASHPTLREAVIAWQTLPHEVKRDASIQSDMDGALYRGWEVYRLWGRWES